MTLSRDKLSREPRENFSHDNKNGLQVLNIVRLIYYVNIIRTRIISIGSNVHLSISKCIK